MSKESPEPLYDNEIAGFRQPMVTSLGIIVGFLLAFLANWAVESDEGSALQTEADFAVAGTIALSILTFALVLYRLLDNRVVEQPGLRYRVTLRFYMYGIALAFAGLGAALLV